MCILNTQQNGLYELNENIEISLKYLLRNCAKKNVNIEVKCLQLMQH